MNVVRIHLFGLALSLKMMLCCANLAETFVQVGQCAWNNASITVMLGSSSDGKSLPTARLPIGKYGAIIASQYTADTQTYKDMYRE